MGERADAVARRGLDAIQHERFLRA